MPSQTPSQLRGSVGAGGRNIGPDVVLVQTLLARQGQKPGPVDGICGPRTIAAICAYQAAFLRSPDGRIDVDGPTWHRLTEGAGSSRAFGHGGGRGATGGVGSGAIGAAGSGLFGRAGKAGAGVGRTLHPPMNGGNLTRLVERPERGTYNSGLAAVSSQAMVELFGKPRESMSQDDQPVTNPLLKRNIVTESVGPFRVTGLGPAVDSLRQVFKAIAAQHPGIERRFGTAGMLSCRLQRGSSTAISNHAWGTAIDLTIDGVLDERGDGKVQEGLTWIAPIFNKFGWYWGAGFPTEDAMHFDASLPLARKFKNQLK